MHTLHPNVHRYTPYTPIDTITHLTPKCAPLHTLHPNVHHYTPYTQMYIPVTCLAPQMCTPITQLASWCLIRTLSQCWLPESPTQDNHKQWISSPGPTQDAGTASQTQHIAGAQRLYLRHDYLWTRSKIDLPYILNSLLQWMCKSVNRSNNLW